MYPAFVVREKTGVCYDVHSEQEKQEIVKSIGGTFTIVPFSDVTNLSRFTDRDVLLHPIKNWELKIKPAYQ